MSFDYRQHKKKYEELLISINNFIFLVQDYVEQINHNFVINT